MGFSLHAVAALSDAFDSVIRRVRGSAPDGSSPRGYVQLFIVGHRLNFALLFVVIKHLASAAPDGSVELEESGGNLTFIISTWCDFAIGDSFVSVFQDALAVDFA